jgi:hypothetical protein
MLIGGYFLQAYNICKDFENGWIIMTIVLESN